MEPDVNDSAGPTAISERLPSVTDTKAGSMPAWFNPTCSLIAPLACRNLAHGNIERQTSMVDESRENNLFLNRRSEEHTSELQSRGHLVCRLLLEKKKQKS